MNDAKTKKRLKQGLEMLGCNYSASQIKHLLDFVELLQKWNKTYNLTAVRDPLEMIAHHLLDSLAIEPHLRGEKIVDIGSGAGLPGIPLAIDNPERLFLLVDSNSKKTRFIQHTAAHLGLENVSVFHGRGQDYPAEPGFDTVVCRALAALPKLIEIGGHLVVPGGIIVAQKGLLPIEELAELPQDWVATETRIQVPFLEAQERHVIIMQRTTR